MTKGPTIYNTIASLFVIFTTSISLALAFITICFILYQPTYIKFFSGLIVVSFKISNFFSSIAICCLVGMIIVFLFASFLEFSFSKTIFDLFETWELRRFIKKISVKHFNPSVLSSYVDSSNQAQEVKWLIKIPLQLDRAVELKNKLNYIYEYISYNHHHYIFSNFERKENYYILTGTRSK